MNKFLKQDYDKFKDKTTTTLVNPISVKRSEEHSTMWISEKSDFNLRHISMPDLNTLVMDIHTNISRTDDLGAGNLLMIIDDSQRYTLKAHESYSSPYETIKKTSCWYEISTDLLKAICDAQTIDLRITAQDDSKYADLYIEKNTLQWAAKVMYNAIVDNTAYLDELQVQTSDTKKVDSKTESNNDEAQSDNKVPFGLKLISFLSPILDELQAAVEVQTNDTKEVDSKTESNNDEAQSDNGTLSGLKLISFLSPIVGWVLYFVFKNVNSTKAGVCAKFAWIGLVCGIILQFILITTFS